MSESRIGRRRSAVLVVFALALAGIVSAVAPASATGRAQDGPPEQVLERDMRGEEAIRGLGDRLPAVAAQNEMSPAEFKAELRRDSMLWVSRTGQLLFVDDLEFGDHDHDEVDMAHGTLDGTAVPSDTEIFTLHSRPGADRVIVLDFNGHDARGTAWGDGAAQNTAPYDFEGGPGVFTEKERTQIFSVWQRVAEDYAPFDIDVTTQDPGHGYGATGLEGHGSIRRDDTTDSKYGTRVVITPSKPYNCNCGGVAYVGVYDAVGTTHDWYQPAWVFTAGVGHGAKNIAEAASHEAGHNLGLSHDGTRTSGYYTGHGDWAPIMGVGYYQPITQWSRGEYSGANNKEDDYSVVASNGGPLATDDRASTEPLVSPASGVIENRSDVDSFTVDVSEAGLLTVTARPAGVSPNLDIRLRVTGNGVDAVADPSLVVSADKDSSVGLDATVEVAVTMGTYTVSVDGVGWGDPASTGYSDYGSLGRYTVSSTFTAGAVDPGGDPEPTAPIAPSGLAVVPEGSGVKVSWTDNSSDETGFDVEREFQHKNGNWQGTTILSVGTDVTSLFDAPGSGTFRYRVRAVNGSLASAYTGHVFITVAGSGGGGNKPNKGSNSRVPIS